MSSKSPEILDEVVLSSLDSAGSKGQLSFSYKEYMVLSMVVMSLNYTIFSLPEF